MGYNAGFDTAKVGDAKQVPEQKEGYLVDERNMEICDDKNETKRPALGPFPYLSIILQGCVMRN
jgi:hypothetical protein